MRVHDSRLLSVQRGDRERAQEKYDLSGAGEGADEEEEAAAVKAGHSWTGAGAAGHGPQVPVHELREQSRSAANFSRRAPSPAQTSHHG